MASAPQTGYNAVLKKGATTVGSIRNIGGPEVSAGKADMTHLTSPDRTKEYKPGMVDPGEVTAECLFDPDDAGQVAFETDLYAGTVAAWTIQWGDGATATFNAYPSKSSANTGGPDDPVTYSIALQLTGKVTYAAAA